MSKMNLPNKLTVLRLCLVPVLMTLLFLPNSVLPWEWAYGIGVVIFAATAVTDLLDGRIARANGLVTNFGKFMDPVADKFMVIGTMLALLFRMMRPDIYGLTYMYSSIVVYFFAITIVVIFRELAITSLRLVLVSSSGQVVAAKMLGKIKTFSQTLAIGALMVEPLLEKLVLYFKPDYVLQGVYPICWVLLSVVLVFTLWSGYDYIKGGWKYIATDK